MKHPSSEDEIHARLRKLTADTRQVRKELEELIRHPESERTRAFAHDEHRPLPPKKKP